MFFKKKEKEILAPIDGEIIKMEEVKDPVFSGKMMGDGFAIKASGNEIKAVVTGTLSAVFPSKHAYGITTDDGMEFLIHIGIDTVNENGNGFESTANQGDKVKAGDTLIKIDSDYLLSKGYDLTTMVIFTNASAYKSFNTEYGKTVKAGEVSATYK